MVEVVVVLRMVLTPVLIPVDESTVDDLMVELDVVTPFLVYTDKRLPAPQNSKLFPAHKKLHSETGAGTEPALKLLPQ